MIQAFVSLKLHYPSRTESGMRSFFEALQNAVFSQPTVFRTNVDASVRPYSIDAICEAALNPRCKFVVLRAECEKFWQCTFLLPEKQGGALFFDLQRMQNPRRLSPDSLIEMFKKLYRSMTPRLIRIGDSEAREKLKSRHGLVMMPGLGRIEWLQIVAPEVYGDIYNPSELVAAPGYATEIWEDGALFMRVYDDPNDWDSEDNISQANFIPGFLAGVAKLKDSEKEKETVREFERLWSRAEKTAEKAYEVLSADPNNVPKVETQKAEAKPVAEVVEEAILTPAVDMDTDDLQKREVVYNRLRSEYTVEKENIVKVGVEGPCTIFKVKAERKPMFYATYQDRDLKVFILNAGEDLSRFLSENDCSVKPECLERMKALIGKYYHPEYSLLESLDDLPSTVVRDRRMPEIRERFKPASVEVENGNQVLTLWFYKPEYQGLESLHLIQFEDWPMQIDAKVEATDMENEPEPVEPEPVVETKAEEVPLAAEAVEAVSSAEVEVSEEEEASESGAMATEAESENKANVPAKKNSPVKIVVVILVLIILVAVGLYFGLNMNQ